MGVVLSIDSNNEVSSNESLPLDNACHSLMDSRTFILEFTLEAKNRKRTPLHILKNAMCT